MELPALTGFAVAILPQSTVAVLLNCLPAEMPADENLLIGMSADVARELAASLLQAAEVMDNTTEASRPN